MVFSFFKKKKCISSKKKNLNFKNNKECNDIDYRKFYNQIEGRAYNKLKIDETLDDCARKCKTYPNKKCRMYKLENGKCILYSDDNEKGGMDTLYKIGEKTTRDSKKKASIGNLSDEKKKI